MKITPKRKIGRPETYNKGEIAKELIEWAQQPDSINLNAFCALGGIVPQYITAWAKESPEFSEAYNFAKACIGMRREQKLNNNELHVKAYDLNIAVYDYFLREERRLQAQFESDLKKQETAQASEQQQKLNENFNAWINEQREKAAEREDRNNLLS